MPGTNTNTSFAAHRNIVPRFYCPSHKARAMLSNLQIAFALGGRVHGNGVVAPAPNRGPDDCSLSIVSNEAGDGFIVSPPACQIYVEEMLDRARTLTQGNAVAMDLAFPNRPTRVQVELEPGETTHFPDLRLRVTDSEREAHRAWIRRVLPPGETTLFPIDGRVLVPLHATSQLACLQPDPPPHFSHGAVSLSDNRARTEPLIPPEARPEPLGPNITDMNRHLFELFSPAFVAGYPEAKIEIAWADPKTGNAVNQAKIFSAFDLEKAAAFAFKTNTAGFNVYVAPALRVGTHKSGRASGDDVITARFAWCEYDGKGDAERVYALCKANMLWPAIVVTTGTIPDQRNHLYFEIDGVPTPADLTAMGAGLKKLFDTDAVHNADRVLRLAGSVNWPSPKKMGPEYGYVPELTTLRLLPDSPSYKIETLIGLGATDGSDAGHDIFGAYADTSYKKGRTDDEIIGLLEATRNAKSWHNSMLLAVASMIGRGWSDLQIRLTCAQYCNGGPDDPDLAELIQGGRNKWNTSDGDDEDVEAKQPDQKEGDERVANQAPVASELPVIRISPRISEVTARTQKMLIRARVPFYQRGGEWCDPSFGTLKRPTVA
jgi:hypothetical protein